MKRNKEKGIEIVMTKEEYENSKYSTYDWENSVKIKRWEHDFIKEEYTIVYIELN